MLASAAMDGTIKVWDAAKRQEFVTYSEVPELLTSVVFSRKGHRLAVASIEGTVRGWDTDTGNAILVQGIRK